MKKFVLLSILLIAGSGCKKICYATDFQDMDPNNKYVIKEKIYTPNGFEIYPNKNKLDLSVIDKKIKLLGKCLKKEIKKSCFSIYVPDNWFVSKCSGKQKLPIYANIELCRKKGQKISEECKNVSSPTKSCPCPCTWRAATTYVRRGKGFYKKKHPVIIVPPGKDGTFGEMFLFELARIITGINRSWENGDIVDCINDINTKVKK